MMVRRIIGAAAALAVLSAATWAPERDRATTLMYALTESRGAAAPALETIVRGRDARFVSVLIELLRAGQIGAVATVDDGALVRALEALSHQRFGADWPAWVEWYGGTPLAPPPGFTGWKGRLLSRIDPRFGDFFSDALPSRIRIEEIEWGGVRVDGIPALTNPSMVPAAAATYLTPEEPVFGLSVNGDARAYPLRILDWHEMVNDRVGGVPIALAYCTLCGSGIAYNARTSAGVTYTFGSSGLLYRSNKLMFDRQTSTLWDQLTGEAVLGELAGSSARLTLRPVVLAAWKEWLTEHPETRVADIHTGYERAYAPGVPYGQYFASPDPMFPLWRRSKVLPAKARIYALRLNGVPKAFPVDVLVAKRVVNDVVGGTAVVLIATHGRVTVSGRRQTGPMDRSKGANVVYDAGSEVRAYNRDGETFRPGPVPGMVIDSAGRPWQVTEDALIGGGTRAARVDGFLAYWFAWYAFFPQSLVYQP
jgi:uncharacterized protein DUF3179